MTDKISEKFNDQDTSVTTEMTMSEYLKFMVKVCNYLEREAALYRAAGNTEKADETAKFEADTRASYEAQQVVYIASLRAEGFDLDPQGNIVFASSPAPSL